MASHRNACMHLNEEIMITCWMCGAEKLQGKGIIYDFKRLQQHNPYNSVPLNY